MTAEDGRRFTLADADLLTAISFQLGLAIENARLYERTDERLREKLEELSTAERRSRFLAEVGVLLGSSMDADTVMEMVASKTTEMVGDACAIYLIDGENDRLLRLKALANAVAGDDEVESVKELLVRRPLEVGRGAIGLVAQDGQPHLFVQVDREQLARENRYLAQSVEDIAVLSKVAPKSRIAAPLRAHGRTNGVLAIYSFAESEPLQEPDLALVTELADRLGVAVENMRLFHESQARRLRLEAIIGQMADGVVVTNEVGEAVVVNVAAEKMLGGLIAPSSGMKPQNGCKSKKGTISPSIRALVMRALAGEMILGEEFNVGAPPLRRVLNATASPVRDDDREITGAVLVLRDVTVEREVDRMKEEFVATVSHELRTPITAVLGYTDILLRGLRGPLEPKQVDALSSVRTAGERLLALINDLLDISRLEAGAQDMSIRPLDLAESINRAIEAFSGLALSREIEMLQAIPVSLPLVQGDEELLQRILGNLLSNALKFTPEGGTVVVSAMAGMPSHANARGAQRRQDHGQDVVSVMVTDTGIGVPREQQEKIWEKFQQADSSSRRSFGGTGLGLAIAKGLVELHGGTVWLESEGLPGKGSTFGFTLRVAKSA
ncbi:MAG TPA: ATP-binding protein [Chloroflexota bacterium]|nr:ATP-binding protein [Chloroflexota bacterium]